MGLEHQVELLDVREITLAAAGTGNLLFPDICDHLIIGHGFHVDIDAVFLGPFLYELVGAVTPLAAFAVDQRIIEVGDVPGSDPDSGVHEDIRIQTDVVRALLDEFLPPGAFDVVLEFYAQRAVVPGVGQTAVDLTAGEDETAVFAERYDLVHGLF